MKMNHKERICARNEKIYGWVIFLRYFIHGEAFLKTISFIFFFSNHKLEVMTVLQVHTE